VEPNSATGPGADEGFAVVINAEGQYSVWRLNREVPAGWRRVGVQGARAECLAHIAGVWPDMRPLSLRARLDGEPA
jgi:MbtH protein